MFVNDGGGPAPANNISASMNDFAQAAASGSFAVSETGGQALIDAIDRLLEWVNGSALDMQLLSQQPKLGGSGGAKTISPFAQKVATDHQGFLTVLQDLKSSLTTAKQGIRAAMANYEERDWSGADKLTAAKFEQA